VVGRDVPNGNLTITAVQTGTPTAIVGVRPWERVTTPAPFGSQSTVQREMYWYYEPKVSELLGGSSGGSETYSQLGNMFQQYKFYRVKSMMAIFRPNAARPFVDIQTLASTDQDMVRGPEAWFCKTGPYGPILPALPTDGVNNWSYDEMNLLSATAQYRIAGRKGLIHISDMNRRRKPIVMKWRPREYYMDNQLGITFFGAGGALTNSTNLFSEQYPVMPTSGTGVPSTLDLGQGMPKTRKSRWHRTVYYEKNNATGATTPRLGLKGQYSGISGCFGMDTWLQDSYLPWTMQFYMLLEFKGGVDIPPSVAGHTYPTYPPQMRTYNDFTSYGTTIRPNPY